MQTMQEQMANMQADMQHLTVEGASGGRLVIATLNGKGELLKIKIDPQLIKEDEIEILEDLIVAAINDGKSKSDQRAAEEMEKITGGLQMPAGFKLPF